MVAGQMGHYPANTKLNTFITFFGKPERDGLDQTARGS